MAHNALLAGGLLILIILALAQLPAPLLLRPDQRTRVATGVLGGLVSVGVLYILRLNAPELEVVAYPTATAFMGLYFGPLSAGITLVLALVGVLLMDPASGVEASTVLASAFVLGLGWRQVLRRWPDRAWATLLGMALTLPPVTLLSALAGGAPWPNDAADWLQQLHWYHGAGVIILGTGRELLGARALSLLKLKAVNQALEQREQQLRLALEAMGGGRWEWDVPSRTFRCEGEFYEHFGLSIAYGPDLWERWYALRHPADRERNAAHLQQAMSGLVDVYDAEFRVRDEQGRWHWLMSRGMVVEHDAQGRGVRLVGMDIDISAHREVEDALRLSDAKYTSFFQTLPDPAGISRISDGRYIDVNPAFCELFGLPREAIVGKSSIELRIWASDEERQRLVQAFQRDGMVDKLSMDAYAQGRRIPGQMSARSVSISGEDCFVFIFHDLTEAHRTSTELRATNQLLEQAGRLARLGAWEENRETGSLYWSSTCADIHGLSYDQPPPRNYIDEMVLPAYRDEMRRRVRESMRTGTEWNMEMEVRHSSGQPLWVRARGEPVSENGRITRIQGVMQDIDESKRAEQQLRQSEERFSRIFQLMPYPMGLSQRSDGRYLMLNPAWEDMLGIPMDQALGRTALELGIFTNEERQRLIQAVETHGQLNSYEVTLQTPHNGQRTVLQSMRATLFEGQPCWLFSVLDITDRKREELRIREREELLSLTLSAATLGLWDWDLQTGCITGDQRWHTMRGLPGTPETALEWTQALTADDVAATRAELQRHTQQPATPFDMTWHLAISGPQSRWVRNLGKVVSLDATGLPLRMLGVSIDVTLQREQEVLLQQLALYDALTGLPNRVLLGRRLGEMMDLAAPHGQLLGVAYLDLDGFKPVNDRYGHGAGDRLLVSVARRLTDALRSQDCVARLGGDEFVVLMPELTSGADAERLLSTLMERIAAPYVLDGERVLVTASIGYTLYPADPSDADTLLRHADQAMYAAKQAGRNRFHEFDAAQDRALQLHREHARQLRSALAGGQFLLYLQPKVDMRSGAVVGAEALARWLHPERGIVSPGEFLPLLEGSDLEISFGEWVVEAALAVIERLGAAGLPLPVSVNISAQHIQRSGFADWLTQRLAHHPAVRPQQLEIEITESAALYDLATASSALTDLRELGVTVSLDDFGTGYSSLTYLRRLPLDTLKIDQSFVHGMMTDSGDLAIVQGVIGLARSFGYRVIAEGVETVEQGQMLLKLGCLQAQGYCIARPMPLEDFIGWTPTWQPPAGWQRNRPVL